MNLKCENCQYVWEYKGNSKFYATCPHCLRKVRVFRQGVAKETNSNFLSWIAGFWEGEGSFVVRKDKKGHLRVRLSISQSKKEPLEYIAKQVGGKIGISKPSRTSFGHRVIYCWYLEHKSEVIGFVESLVPYLTFRKEEVQKKLGILKKYFGAQRNLFWTRKEIEILKKNWSKLSIVEIRKRLNRSDDSIYGQASRLGLRKSENS